MKVLHFKTNYLNLSETFINRLVQNHQEFEPVVATCYPQHYTDDVSLYSMPDSGVDGLWNTAMLKLNKSPSFLYNVINQENPAVIHGHFGLDSYRLIDIKRTFELPFVVNFYGYDVLRLPQEFGWKLRYQRLAKKGDLFFVGSKDMKHNIINLGFPPEKIRVLKLGMNLDNIRFEQRRSAGTNLMMVGRMVEKKGFKYAIQAVGLLRDQGVITNLDLYGDGELRESLEELVGKLSLEKQVTFHGQTGNETIFEELYNHDILLVPSVQAHDGDREGIPQTTVEGMATGIPVIASDHAGLPELVIDGQTGLQVPQRDAKALSKAIKTYLETPDLIPQISKNGRERVELEHSISRQVKKAEQWYRSIVLQ